MQIPRAGRTNDLFAEALKLNMEKVAAPMPGMRPGDYNPQEFSAQEQAKFLQGQSPEQVAFYKSNPVKLWYDMRKKAPVEPALIPQAQAPQQQPNAAPGQQQTPEGFQMASSDAEVKTAAELPPKEEQLEDDREKHDQEPANKITETDLSQGKEGNRKDGDNKPDLIERMLEEKGKPKVAAPNADTVSSITEKRLNDASKAAYPHRNPEAWERTGDKRPVNALPEEMGKASDAEKRKRWDKANKAGPTRLVDKNPGEQMTNEETTIKIHKAYNHHRQVEASSDKVGAYVEYRNATASSRFAAVKEVDDAMEGIMVGAFGRALSKSETAKIAALKMKKSELLNIK